MAAELPTVVEISDAGKVAACEVAMCLPGTLIGPARNLTSIEPGGQDCHAKPSGAAAEDTVSACTPIQPIGTGLTPGADEFSKMNALISPSLPNADMPILHDGSVSAENATGIFALADMDGGLVDGASPKAETFIPIIQAPEARP